MRSMKLIQSALAALSQGSLTARSVAALVLCLGSVWGQVETTTSITGTIADSTGAVIVEASVKLVNQETGATRQTATNDRGVYAFRSLPAGTYEISVASAGFKAATVKGRVVQTAQPAHVDITLEIGSSQEHVTVSAAGAELINTASAEVTGAVSQEFVQNTPLGRGNVFDLLEFIPGVVPQNIGSNLSFAANSLNYVSTANTQQSSGAFIAGNRDSGANVSIDGANVQTPVYGQATLLQSRASVQEVRVESSNMSAEFGNGVAAVNMITKSGSNSLHGELFEYLRNSALDANGFFNNLAGRSLPPYTQNQFGGTAGGPIRRNKLLFFGSYEGFRVAERAQGIVTVPDDNVRQGDFSRYVSGGVVPVIYNPYNFNPATGLRLPFPENRIPASMFDPATSAYLQKYVARPNVLLDGTPTFTDRVATTMGQNQVTGRIDWLHNSYSNVYGRFTYSKMHALADGLQVLQGTNNDSGATNAVLHWTKVLGTSKVNDFGISFARPRWSYTRPLDLPDATGEIGLKNTSSYTGGPQIQVPGVDMGVATNYMFDSITNNIQLKDDFGWLKGRHNLKFGFEGADKRLIYYNAAGDKGTFAFSKFFTQACPPGNRVCEEARAVAGSAGGLELADYLLGAFSNDRLVMRQIPYVGHQKYLGFYAQDSWRVSGRFTLSFGLRYEYWSPWLVPRNTTLSFDFARGVPLFALRTPNDFLDPDKCFGKCAPLTPGVPRQGYSIGTKNLAPRMGATYMLTPATVLRAGIGIYFDGNINMNQFNDIQTNSTPFNLRYEYVNDTSQPLPTRFVRDEFPAGLLGAVPRPNDNPVAAFRFAMPYYPIPAVYQWSASLQRRVSPFWAADLTYVGSHTIHQFQFLDMNSAGLPQGAAANAPLQQRRPYPQWGILGTWAPIGWAKYHAGTASLTNNRWHGFTFQGNFTWAKNLSTTNIGQSDQGNVNYRVPYIWAGPSSVTPKYWFIAAGNYQVPKIFRRRGPAFAANDWLFTATFRAATGSPYFVRTQDLTGTSMSASTSVIMPDQICDPTHGENLKTRLGWFNRACFVNPAFGVWGNATLGSVTQPGTNNWNISAAKRFSVAPLRENHEVEFRVNLLNALNHTQWLTADTDMRSATYGRVTSARPARQIQFAVRYLF